MDMHEATIPAADNLLYHVTHVTLYSSKQTLLEVPSIHSKSDCKRPVRPIIASLDAIAIAGFLLVKAVYMFINRQRTKARERLTEVD
jgi:hypothetical protein